MGEIVKVSDITIPHTDIKIGVSDALNNHTFEEIYNSPYCASSWDWIKNFQNQYFGQFLKWGHSDVNNAPLTVTNFNTNNYPYNYTISNGEMEYNNAEGVFARVIYLYSENGFTASITKNADLRVVTNIDVNKFRLLFTPFEQSADKHFTEYSAQVQYKYNDVYIDYNNIRPYIMFSFDNVNYIYMPFGRGSVDYHYAISYTPQTDSTQAYEWNAQMLSWDETVKSSIALNLDLKGEISGNTQITERKYRLTPDNPDIGAQITIGRDGHGGIKYIPDNADTYNKIISLYGFPFFTDKNYKPIIENGYVTGYSDDLTKKSDIDNYTYDSGNKHEVPDRKPEHDDDDSETDMDIGSLYSASGMVHYYNVTSENLQKLSKLMSNVDVVGTKNLLPNLISLKAFPISFDKLGRGVAKTIEIGGVEMSDSIAGTAQGTTVDSTYNFLSCCDTTIQGKYGDISNPHFLDFSPYTQVELILPLAGSVVLPDNAMYKSLNVAYVYDIVNGSAICVVKSNGTVISTIPCTLSQDVPFSAINVGSKTSAMISNITNVAQNVATLGVSMGTGNVVSAISSGIGTVGSIAQAVIANNQNYMEKFGRTGDMCDFGLVKKAYIKYTRPVVIIPENFGRTNGYLCNVTKKLSDCSGFTMCENVNINVSATDTEKRMIKQLLETGVYI